MLDAGSEAPIDPTRGVIVANYNDMPNYVRLVPRAIASKRGWYTREQKANMAKASDAAKRHSESAGDPQAQAPYAIDVNAGWQMPITGCCASSPLWRHLSDRCRHREDDLG